MSRVELLPGYGSDEVEERATKLVAAMLAIFDFARPEPEAETDELVWFEVAGVRALITCLAAWVAHDHQDEEQHEEMLEAVIALLRAGVTEAQAG